MTYRYVDPHRPHIDGTAIHCPACKRTYDAIAGRERMPRSHLKINGLALITDRLCSIDGDTLVALLFQAQVFAEEKVRAAS